MVRETSAQMPQTCEAGSTPPCSAGTKLASWLKNGGHRPLLVSVDLYRPAAREQLKVVAQAIRGNIYEGQVMEANTATVERLAKEARREAMNTGCDVLIVDTAGRLHIDEQLMDEMQLLKKLLSPQEILFVADAMTGQDAVRSADEFHKKLALTGVVLTKMDGDARGGAALSIRQVTGQPIKFIGVGEKYDALEPFHRDQPNWLDATAPLRRNRRPCETQAAATVGRGLPRSTASSQEDGVIAEPGRDAAAYRPVLRTTGRR